MLQREKAQALLKARTRSTTGVKETSFGDVPEQASVEQASVAETTLMAKRASEHGSVAEEASVLDDNESEDSFLAEHQHREPMTPDENDEAQVVRIRLAPLVVGRDYPVHTPGTTRRVVSVAVDLWHSWAGRQAGRQCNLRCGAGDALGGPISYMPVPGPTGTETSFGGIFPACDD